MVLAAVDDLLFASKIRSTAARLGREAVFARSTADVLDQAATRAPDVIVIDLDSRRFDAVATIAAIKALPALAGVPVIGFVSHVHTHLVAAAREAGADQVLARSAFVAALSEIVAGTR